MSTPSPEEQRLTKKIEDEKAIRAALQAEQDTLYKQEQALTRELGLRVVALEAASRIYNSFGSSVQPAAVISYANEFLSFLQAAKK